MPSGPLSDDGSLILQRNSCSNILRGIKSGGGQCELTFYRTSLELVVLSLQSALRLLKSKKKFYKPLVRLPSIRIIGTFTPTMTCIEGVIGGLRPGYWIRTTKEHQVKTSSSSLAIWTLRLGVIDQMWPIDVEQKITNPMSRVLVWPLHS